MALAGCFAETGGRAVDHGGQRLRCSVVGAVCPAASRWITANCEGSVMREKGVRGNVVLTFDSVRFNAGDSCPLCKCAALQACVSFPHTHQASVPPLLWHIHTRYLSGTTPSPWLPLSPLSFLMPACTASCAMCPSRSAWAAAPSSAGGSRLLQQQQPNT